MLKIIRIEKCKGGWEQMEGDYEKGDWDLWKVWEQYRYEDGLNLCFKVTSAQSFTFLFFAFIFPSTKEESIINVRCDKSAYHIQ